MTVPAETLQPLPWDADIASAAALIADSTRAAILRALLPDRPLAAGELARLAGVSAATASFHLAKLLEGGLITVIRQGRHRYYRLAGHEVQTARACGHLPLKLEIFAAVVRQRTVYPVTDLLARLEAHAPDVSPEERG